ncbi:MAG: NUDIX domain-containing protein [Clostridia bacterium]
MEKRDLYDLNRKLTGETIYKGEVVPLDRRILVVIVFIENSKKEFLIQKRSMQKDGKYGSTGGHPKTGETSIQGILTEMKEEIGIEVLPEELIFLNTCEDKEGRVFVDSYYLRKDLEIKDLILQTEEVELVKWCSIAEIEQLYKQGLFLKSHYIQFQKCLTDLEVLYKKEIPFSK